MIDYQVYYKFHSISDAFRFSEKRKAAYDEWPSQIPYDTDLSPVNLMLLPPGIHGFIMKEKKWGEQNL